MATHTAKGLFDRNVESAVECLQLYDGVSNLKTQLQIDWILRAAIVFVVSALDTYFHDKVRYRIGRSSLTNLPPALAKFTVPLSDLPEWDKATRKGNVIRNWVMNHLAIRPLQTPDNIAEALKLASVNSLWDTIDPDKKNKKELLDQFNLLIRRRNQISHEGDRMTSRRSGKKLREITRDEVKGWLDFARDMVQKIENAFPN